MILQGVGCKSLNMAGFTLSGVPIRNLRRGVDKAVAMDVGGPVAYTTTMCLGSYIAFAEKLVKWI